MDTSDIIQKLCQENEISIAALEKRLNFGNGTLAKHGFMRSDRLKKVAEHFNVSMEYLMTGEEPECVPLQPFQKNPEFMNYVLRFWGLPPSYREAVYKAIRNEERDYKDELDEQRKKDNVSAS